MKESGVIDPPDIAEHWLLDAVRTAWHVPASAIRFLPIGLDVHASAFEVTADGERFFLKVRSRPADVTIPQLLHEGGLDAVVAPRPTTDGRPGHHLDGWQLLLYPFIEGENLWTRGLTDGQWREYGRFLARLHDVRLPAEVASQVARETYTSDKPRRLREITGELSTESLKTPAQRELATFWREHRERLHALADDTERYARAAADSAAPHVLCHADIHPGNLMARNPDSLWVIDWDAPILAPRERDLMFVIGSDFGAQPANEELFRAGYGPTVIDHAVLAYYLHERICDDTVVNAEHILRADVSEAARVDGLHWTRAQFAPGSSLDRAHETAARKTV